MLIILGGPGSGKGTQGRIVSEFLGVNFLSAGDSLKKTLQLRQNFHLIDRINRGIIMEDDEVNNIILEHLQTIEQGSIFEGFPRTTHQANFLYNNFDIKRIDGLVILLVEKSVILDRLSTRYICSLCHSPYEALHICCGNETIRRMDDENNEAILQRISNFNNSIYCVRDFFTKHNIPIVTINGNQGKEEVRNEIVKFYNGAVKSKYTD